MANFLSVFHHDFKMLLTRRLIPLLCITLMITSMFMPWFSVFAENDAALDLDRVDSFLIAQVKAHRIPGLAVAIVQNDQIIFMEGYGNAAPGKPVTPQTQFYIGSVTKSFTALAAMQLVEQGKLELDSPVQEYLPWFQVADPEASAEITVRHLLNHTSGLSEIGDPDPSAYTSSLDEQARKLKRVQLTAPIGSQYKYYNQNYRLVGLLIEVVSGQSYKRYLQDHIFASMGMSHSTADPATASELAQGYSRVFGFPLSRSQKFVPGALPSGYLISTAEDMSKYLLALLNNQLSDGSQLLQPELLETMRTPPPGIDSEYGMGWLVTDNDSTLIHGGALEYFQSFVMLNLEEDIGLVILFNQNSMENLMLINKTIRDGLLDMLKGKSPQQTTYAWINWLLLTLATLDLLNHLRLFQMLSCWRQKTSTRNCAWVWTKVVFGILLPSAIIFGLPTLVAALQGGSSSWIFPLSLAPDLTIWLLVGMSFNLLRNLMRAVLLIRQ